MLFSLDPILASQIFTFISDTDVTKPFGCTQDMREEGWHVDEMCIRRDTKGHIFTVQGAISLAFSRQGLNISKLFSELVKCHVHLQGLRKFQNRKGFVKNPELGNRKYTLENGTIPLIMLKCPFICIFAVKLLT